MKLNEYSSLSDKDKSFLSVRIDNKSELDDFLNIIQDCNDSENYIYRGVSEAKYMIYTSAQRYWQTQEFKKTGKTFNDFIESLIDNAKKSNNNLLSKYFRSFNVFPNDFLMLSFLQHYKAPSPLLDFSYNIFKGLFFCVDEMEYKPSLDIGNYCSLYIINKKYLTGRNEIISLLDFLQQTCEDADRSLENQYSLNPKQKKVGTSQFEKMIKECTYRQFSPTKLLFIPGLKSRTFRVSQIPNFIANIYHSNLNLIAQEGAFLFFGDDANPLESYFGESTVQHSLKLMPITCINIHKSLQEYIVETYLKPRRINKDTIYPQEESIAQKAFFDFKKTL